MLLSHSFGILLLITLLGVVVQTTAQNVTLTSTSSTSSNITSSTSGSFNSSSSLTSSTSTSSTSSTPSSSSASSSSSTTTSSSSSSSTTSPSPPAVVSLVSYEGLACKGNVLFVAVYPLGGVCVGGSTYTLESSSYIEHCSYSDVSCNTLKNCQNMGNINVCTPDKSQSVKLVLGDVSGTSLAASSSTSSTSSSATGSSSGPSAASFVCASFSVLVLGVLFALL